MHRLWLRQFLLMVTACVLQGCVSVHAPLEADKDYPHDWGELTQLGQECALLEGTYQNAGVAIDADGMAQPLLLTSALNIKSNAQTVRLAVHTRKRDQNGDSFITLRVAPDGDPNAIQELGGCFCIKQTLACTQMDEKYWSMPYVGLGGSQTNIYMSISSDRALIAKLQNYHADVVLGIPVFGKKEPWARFIRSGK